MHGGVRVTSVFLRMLIRSSLDISEQMQPSWPVSCGRVEPSRLGPEIRYRRPRISRFALVAEAGLSYAGRKNFDKSPRNCERRQYDFKVRLRRYPAPRVPETRSLSLDRLGSNFKSKRAVRHTERPLTE